MATRHYLPCIIALALAGAASGTVAHAQVTSDLTLIVSDAGNGAAPGLDTLHWGINPNATNGKDASLGEEEQPPAPPEGVFDARWINVGSSSYMMQEDFFPGYAIAKSGVEGITRTMARTFGPNNVRVNTVLPGWVPTRRQLDKWWSPEGEAATLNDQALKRRIPPDEFAQIILFLAADDSRMCTGQDFIVDGGWV